jgi:hypothetical protein
VRRSYRHGIGPFVEVGAAHDGANEIGQLHVLTG